MNFEYTFPLLTNVRVNILLKYLEKINMKVNQKSRSVVHFYIKIINKSMATASTVIALIIILIVIVTTATIVITDD